MIRQIAAIDSARGVADDGGIPWQGQIPTDAQYFRDQTSHGVIVMGYATYHEFDHPVHDRENFVVTRPDRGALRPGFVGIADVKGFLDQHREEVVWVIGGAALFASTLHDADQLYLTQLDRDFHCNRFFPPFVDTFELAHEDPPLVEGGIEFRFQIWQRSKPR